LNIDIFSVIRYFTYLLQSLINSARFYQINGHQSYSNWKSNYA